MSNNKKWKKFESQLEDYYKFYEEKGMEPICLCKYCKGTTTHEDMNKSNKKRR